MLVAILSAFLGGLILNCMPCVFPIISLKAFGLVRQGGEPALLRREGMAFMAGSVLAMLALAGVLLGPAGRWRGGGLGLSIAIADDRGALGAGDDRVGAQSDGPV
jgi:thiol:disulfide interchange protein DsbD